MSVMLFIVGQMYAEGWELHKGGCLYSLLLESPVPPLKHKSKTYDRSKKTENYPFPLTFSYKNMTLIFQNADI